MLQVHFKFKQSLMANKEEHSEVGQVQSLQNILLSLLQNQIKDISLTVPKFESFLPCNNSDVLELCCKQT